MRTACTTTPLGTTKPPGMMRPLAATALVLLLGGCAGTAEGPNELATEARTVGTDCFTVSQARDFGYLDDRNLIVYAPARRAYHVELAGPCMGLRGRSRIALRARTDRMCGFGGDAVMVNGGFPERCPVRGVRRLDEDELQRLLERFEAAGAPADAVEIEIPADDELPAEDEPPAEDD